MRFLVYGVKQDIKYTTSMACHVWKYLLGHLNVDSDDWDYFPSHWNDNDCNECVWNANIFQISKS